MKFVIEVSNVTRINSPVLRGKFDLQYGGIRILGMLVFAKENKRWVSFPSQISEDDAGNKSYITIIKTVSKDSLDKLNRFCLDHDEIDALFEDPPAPVQEEAWPEIDGPMPDDLPDLPF